jgi:zinc transport system permease protein
MNLWHSVISALPFEWAQYDFMRNALLAAVIVTPCFGVLGTMVVGRGMAFFSDVIGHSALTGVALGVLLGFADPQPVLVAFVVVLAFIINGVSMFTKASADTVIGVFSAAVIALGVALLSRGGSFNKYTVYLVGDILSVTSSDILQLSLMFLGVILFWIVFGNRLFLSGVNASLISGSRPSAFFMQSLFSIILALVVALSIKWVGILVINSLLVLPAASSRIIARTVRGYTLISCGIGLFSGIAGLLVSFYVGTAGGASIVLCSVFIYASVLMLKKLL